MNEVTTNEIRTCKECSKTYQHQPAYLLGPEKDWNADLYKCPTCAPIVEEREERERLAREEEERREAKEKAAKESWESIVPLEYRETDTSHPDYPQAIHRKAIEWQKDRESGDRDTSLFLGLIGPSGRCKSRVISQVIKRMIWAGKRCEWVNAAKFQRLVQGQWNNDKVSPNTMISSSSPTVGELARRELASFQRCQVLALDDLGKGKLTDTVAAALYDLIEERTSHGLVTLWTSNASLDDLLQMLPRDCGGPIVRRLIDFSLIIKV